MLLAGTWIVLAMAIVLWAAKALAEPPAPPAGIEYFPGQFPAPNTPFADDHASATAINHFSGKIVILICGLLGALRA
jgi:hypothetical protein